MQTEERVEVERRAIKALTDLAQVEIKKRKPQKPRVSTPQPPSPPVPRTLSKRRNTIRSSFIASLGSPMSSPNMRPSLSPESPRKRASSTLDLILEEEGATMVEEEEETVVIDEGQLEGHLQCARALCELSLRPRLRGLIIDENGLPAFATMLSVKNRDVRLLPCFCMCRLTVDLKARLCAQIAVDCLTALSRLSQSPLLHLKLMGVEGVGDEASYQKRADAVTKPVSVVTILQSVDLSLDPVLAPLVPCLLVPWLLSIIPGHACFVVVPGCRDAVSCVLLFGSYFCHGY
jgi:hypothetical protein